MTTATTSTLISIKAQPSRRGQTPGDWSIEMDIRSEVYNALADIMFMTDATEKDMDEAIEWFQIHFYDHSED